MLLIEPEDPGALTTATVLRAARPGLPIVCLSSHTPKAEVRSALEPAVFMPKPFSVAELHAVVLELLSKLEPEPAVAPDVLTAAS